MAIRRTAADPAAGLEVDDLVTGHVAAAVLAEPPGPVPPRDGRAEPDGGHSTGTAAQPPAE